MHILHMCRIIFKKLINQNLFVSSTIHTCAERIVQTRDQPASFKP